LQGWCRIDPTLRIGALPGGLTLPEKIAVVRKYED
jgi:hypothetical protein